MSAAEVETAQPAGLPWALADVVRATGASVARTGRAERFGRVATDTRALAGDDLFVALRGEHHDAHDFVADAVRAGAAGVLVARAVELPAAADVVVLQVPDTLRALQDLAADLRRRVAPRVLAITGSNGKTTTKEMLAAILAAAAGPSRVLKTRGNLNNLIGVPLTLLGLGGGETFAVIEMGMNAPGEIQRLTEIADPDVGVITNVGPAHLEGLGSIEGVARAKGELFATLRPDAVAVANADDPHVRALGDAFPGRVVRFGSGGDVTAESVRCDARGAAAFRLRIGDRTTDVALQIPGRHNVANALAAASLALGAGASLEAVRDGLGAARAVAGRLVTHRLQGGALLIDDSYNANPGSLNAAIDTLATAPGERWLVLGDMRELGVDGEALHAEAGRRAKAAGIGRLLTLGTLSAAASTAFGAGATHFATHADIAEAIRAGLRPDLRVLVKGSRGSAMDRVVKALLDAVGTQGNGAPGGMHAA